MEKASAIEPGLRAWVRIRLEWFSAGAGNAPGWETWSHAGPPGWDIRQFLCTAWLSRGVGVKSSAAWLTLPGQVDVYLGDRFGLRHALIRAHKDLTKPMLGFGGSDSVLVGRNGHFFYLGEDAVRQSAGLIVRDERVSQTVALLARNKDIILRARSSDYATPPWGVTASSPGSGT